MTLNTILCLEKKLFWAYTFCHFPVANLPSDLQYISVRFKEKHFTKAVPRGPPNLDLDFRLSPRFWVRNPWKN